MDRRCWVRVRVVDLVQAQGRPKFRCGEWASYSVIAGQCDGLASGIHTLNLKRAHRVARALRAGTVWVDTYNMFDSSTPFGGYKSSGFGREGGLHADSSFTEQGTDHEILVTGVTGYLGVVATDTVYEEDTCLPLPESGVSARVLGGGAPRCWSPRSATRWPLAWTPSGLFLPTGRARHRRAARTGLRNAAAIDLSRSQDK